MGNILLIKGKYSSPTNDNFLKALSVGLALAGQIFLSSNQGGACYNPAVALASIVLFIPLTNVSESDPNYTNLKAMHDAQLHYMWVFLLMPFIAGAAVGIVQQFHESNCEVMAKAAKKEQAETQGG